MTRVATWLTTAALFSGCSAGSVLQRAEFDVEETLLLCANPPLTQDELDRHLISKGWEPLAGPDSTYDFGLWSAFGIEYVLSGLIDTQYDNLKLGEALENPSSYNDA